MSDNGTATPQPWEIVREFARELERPETFLRTGRPNSLGCFDTQNWGDTGKRAIAGALRDALNRALPELAK